MAGLRFFLALALLASLPALADPDPVLVRAQAGDAGARHQLCYQFLYGDGGRAKDPASAFRWCSAAADSGNPSAQTLLAEMYRFGIHVPKDDARAREWYRLAADQGHRHAQLMLGLMAIVDTDPPDTFQFCFWTRAAAAQGYDKAITQLEVVESEWRRTRKSDGPGFCATETAKAQSGSAPTAAPPPPQDGDATAPASAEPASAAPVEP